MTSPTKRISASKAQNIGKPLIGALLRIPREHVVLRMLTAVNEQGFDVSATELSVFMYPGPQGQRPIELARRCNMSRQAMNYVLVELERRDYIKRHAGPTAASAVVHMTEHGASMLKLMRNCVEVVEMEWMEHLGRPRFNALKDALMDLSVWLGKTNGA